MQALLELDALIFDCKIQALASSDPEMRDLWLAQVTVYERMKLQLTKGALPHE